MTRFTDCVSIVGKTPEKFEGTKRYISTGAVDYDIIDEMKVEYVNYETKPLRANLLGKPGDVFFAKMQSTNKILILDNNTVENIYSTGFFAVRAKKAITPKCLYFLVSSEHFLSQKDKYCSGATQKAITNEGLNKIVVTIPRMELQENVVVTLDKVTRLISLRKQQLAKLDELAKSRFVEMFGDPIHPLRFAKLGDIALLERGRFSPRPRNDPKYFNGDYPFIQTGDIANCNHRLSDYKQTLNELGIKVSKLFKEGTIVIAIVGATIGATAILEREVYAPDSVIGISAKEDKCVPIFLEILLRFWQPELQRIAPESARANINLAILKEIPIVQADSKLQEEFSKFVRATDKLKFEIQKSLEKLETLKKALMQQYFE